MTAEQPQALPGELPVVSYLRVRHPANSAIHDPSPGRCDCGTQDVPLVRLSDARAALAASPQDSGEWLEEAKRLLDITITKACEVGSGATFDNDAYACPPCNIDKHAMSLDGWRRKLQDAANVLTRNSPTYRHAKRFGLVVETGAAIVFHFELAGLSLPSLDGGEGNA